MSAMLYTLWSAGTHGRQPAARADHARMATADERQQRTADAALETALGDQQQVVALKETEAAHDAICLCTTAEWQVMGSNEGYNKPTMAE